MGARAASPARSGSPGTRRVPSFRASPRVSGTISTHEPRRRSPERLSALAEALSALSLVRRHSQSPTRQVRGRSRSPVMCIMSPEEMRQESVQAVFQGARDRAARNEGMRAAVRAAALQGNGMRIVGVSAPDPIAQLVAPQLAAVAQLAPQLAAVAQLAQAAQPNPGETEAQFRRRLRAEAAEKRIAEKKGGTRRR